MKNAFALLYSVVLCALVGCGDISLPSTRVTGGDGSMRPAPDSGSPDTLAADGSDNLATGDGAIDLAQAPDTIASDTVASDTTVDSTPDAGVMPDTTVDATIDIGPDTTVDSTVDAPPPLLPPAGPISVPEPSMPALGYHPSIAFGPAGELHLSYRSASGVRYAKHDTTGWHFEALGAGDQSALVVDAAGTAHIARHQSLQRDLVYSSGTANNFNAEVVHSVAWVGESPEMAISVDGDVHICYWGASDDTLYYARKVVGGAWQISPIADQLPYTTCGIALDSLNEVHVVYQAYELRHAIRSSAGVWSHEVAAPSVYTTHFSFVLDQNDKAYLSYAVGTQSKLYYTDNVSGTWATPVVVDGTNDVGRHNSTGVDSNGNVHIAYYDQYGENLKYATNASGSWVTSFIDTEGVAGQYADLAIDANDEIHIAYYQWANSQNHLRYVRLPAP